MKLHFIPHDRSRPKETFALSERLDSLFIKWVPIKIFKNMEMFVMRVV